MFTGIIENTGLLTDISAQGTNRTFWIKSPISSQLTIDQSVSHNGACLTIEEIKGDTHRVTAIEETLTKTTLGNWQKGEKINLERCLIMGGRLDGHMVQGHVDTTGICTEVKELPGSWQYKFEFPKEFNKLVIEKGSIAINGVSLTCFNINSSGFEVAVIPYTFEHTNFKNIEVNTKVNIEFDIIGKYILRSISQ